jgi:hypothetical protein
MGFFFVQNVFPGQHELEYLFFLSQIFFQEFNIKLYDKNVIFTVSIPQFK